MTSLTFEPHFIDTMRTKGFTVEQVTEALRNPRAVTPVTKYPGQRRYCGGGVAVVVDGTRCVTIYADGIVTPLRPDQQSDPDALTSRRLTGRKAS